MVERVYLCVLVPVVLSLLCLSTPRFLFIETYILLSSSLASLLASRRLLATTLCCYYYYLLPTTAAGCRSLVAAALSLLPVVVGTTAELLVTVVLVVTLWLVLKLPRWQRLLSADCLPPHLPLPPCLTRLCLYNHRHAQDGGAVGGADDAHGQGSVMTRRACRRS